MRYVKVLWPEIQDYMNRPDYNEYVSYDSRKNCWFIPEEWILEDEIEDEMMYIDGSSIGDLEDTMG